MKTIAVAGVAAFGLAALFSPSTAGAAEVMYDTVQQAGGVCQPAREYPDVRVRQREIDNIGTTNAYIVCAPPAYYTGGRLTRVFIRLLNAGAVDRTVSCTMQNGWLPSVTNVNDTEQALVEAGGAGSVEWNAGAFELMHFDSPGVQCILPPDVSLAYVYAEYTANDIDTQ